MFNRIIGMIKQVEIYAYYFDGFDLNAITLPWKFFSSSFSMFFFFVFLMRNSNQLFVAFHIFHYKRMKTIIIIIIYCIEREISPREMEYIANVQLYSEHQQ